MRYPCTMESGWIVAVIFWPDRLTADLQWNEDDPDSQIDQLKREGRLIEIVEGHGNYNILFCFDEPMPSAIEPLIAKRQVLPDIVVKGKTRFGPVGLLATGGLEDFSQFETLHLPEGSYRAELVQAKIPRGLRGQYIRQHAGRWPYFAFTLAWAIYWIEIVLFFPTLASWSWWGWQGGLVTFVAVLLLALIGYLLYRSDAYHQAQAAHEAFNQAHPATILLMTSIAAST